MQFMTVSIFMILGLYLHICLHIFLHGQVYVALSKFRSCKAIQVHVDDNGNGIIETNIRSRTIFVQNFVYKEVLQMAT